MNRVIFVFCSSICPMLLMAQSLEELTSKYQDEQAIYLDYSEDVLMQIVNDSLEITSVNSQETFHIGDASFAFAHDRVYTSSFRIVDSLEATTMLPSADGIDTTWVKEFKRSSDMSAGIFYDDSEYISFTYPSVVKGSITKLKYQERLPDPHFFGSFFFGHNIPAVSSTFRIVCPKEVDLNFEIYNDPDSLIQKKTTFDGKTKEYEFFMKDIPDLEFEPGSPSYNALAAHVICSVKSYTKSDGTKVNILSSTDDLFDWYSGFVSEINNDKSPEIQKIVDDLVDESDTDLEKVKKIFYWVQSNIKYIAFEDGMRGFIPHDGTYICEKRYGDCKDMASIIINMLSHLDIPAHYTWIGTDKLPYKYSELSSPMVDNHMIATYISDGKYYFLDATGQYCKFGQPTSMIQGKEALIHKGSTYEIVEVPIVDGHENRTVTEVEYSLTDGSVVGKGKVHLHGIGKTNRQYRLAATDDQKVDQYVNTVLSMGNNKFFVDHYDLKNDEDRDLPLQIDYDFQIDDYYREVGDRIFFNMNMKKVYSGSDVEEDRVYPVIRKYLSDQEYSSSLVIPEGYKVTSLPKDQEGENDMFRYSIQYSMKEDRVVQKSKVAIKKVKLDPTEFESWNLIIKEYSKALKKALVLQKQKS